MLQEHPPTNVNGERLGEEVVAALQALGIGGPSFFPQTWEENPSTLTLNRYSNPPSSDSPTKYRCWPIGAPIGTSAVRPPDSAARHAHASEGSPHDPTPKGNASLPRSDGVYQVKGGTQESPKVGSPFTLKIQDKLVPPSFWLPMLESYDDSSDPVQHIAAFRAQMALYDTSNALIARLKPAVASLLGLRQKDEEPLEASLHRAVPRLALGIPKEKTGQTQNTNFEAAIGTP
ncbi:hypothetical protein BHM03_00054739 [Ensete ventricosum]|nr:hypothetical protein BHM03_00054739 [Ensete ventricosum]